MPQRAGMVVTCAPTTNKIYSIPNNRITMVRMAPSRLKKFRHVHVLKLEFHRVIEGINDNSYSTYFTPVTNESKRKVVDKVNAM